MNKLIDIFKNTKDLNQEEVINVLKNDYRLKCSVKNNLVLLNYDRTNTDMTVDHLNFCRGLIVDKDNQSIECITFNSKLDNIAFQEKIDFKDTIVYKYYDGTMINLFYHNDQWKTSTKGKIDSKDSYWSSDKNFYTLFSECSNVKYENFDKNLCYSFVIQHVDNRIISKVDSNRLVLVCVRNKITNELQLDNDVSTLGDNIILPEVVDNIENYIELNENVSKLDYNESGYMVFDKSHENRTRYMSSDYKSVETLSKNTPCKLKTLCLLPEKQIVQYLKVYPENNKYLRELNILSRRFVGSLFYYYTKVKIKKEYQELPQHIKKSIFMLHDLYLTRCKTLSASRSTISHKVVKAYFHNLDGNIKYALLNSHKTYLETL